MSNVNLCAAPDVVRVFVDEHMKYQTYYESHHLLESLRRDERKFQEEKRKYKEEQRQKVNRDLRNRIKDVRFSGNRTIVFWSDGTKTVAKCADADIYDNEKGLMAAICKKFYDDKCILPDMIEKWCHNEVE